VEVGLGIEEEWIDGAHLISIDRNARPMQQLVLGDAKLPNEVSAETDGGRPVEAIQLLDND
jgi:hypothetical protein